MISTPRTRSASSTHSNEPKLSSGSCPDIDEPGNAWRSRRVVGDVAAGRDPAGVATGIATNPFPRPAIRPCRVHGRCGRWPRASRRSRLAAIRQVLATGIATTPFPPPRPAVRPRRVHGRCGLWPGVRLSRLAANDPASRRGHRASGDHSPVRYGLDRYLPMNVGGPPFVLECHVWPGKSCRGPDRWAVLCLAIDARVAIGSSDAVNVTSWMTRGRRLARNGYAPTANRSLNFRRSRSSSDSLVSWPHFSDLPWAGH